MTTMRRLGKKLAKHDTRSLRLSRLLSPELPAPPATLDLSGGWIAWPMLANDSVGDCTCAAAAHMSEVWLDHPPSIGYVPMQSAVLLAYSAITGYRPGDSYTDNGAAMIDVLNYWRKNGIDGHSIGGYAVLEPRNIEQVKQAAYLFEGVYVGLQLPQTAEKQLDAGEVWDVEGVGGDGFSGEAQAGSWGGHCVNLVGYDDTGVTVVTWGKLQKLTWAFWNKYCDEAYAIFSEEMFDAAGKDVEGFDRNSVEDFLLKIGGAGADPAPVPPAPFPPPAPGPSNGGGKPILIIPIFTGLGTDQDGQCCGMRAIAQHIADDHPEYETHIIAFGWDEKPPAPYTNDPDGLCRYIMARVIALRVPDRIVKIVGLRHSFGGALGVFFDQWLWAWYSGPEQNSPPFAFDVVADFDPCPNAVHFGDSQHPNWFEPEATVKVVFCPYQRDGVLIGIVGEPLFERVGVINLNVSTYRDPRLGHVDFPLFGLTGIIQDSRVQKDLLGHVDTVLSGRAA